MIDGGRNSGKAKVSMVIENDESMNIHRVPLSDVMPYSRFNWPKDLNPDVHLLCKAIKICSG